jgi:hypothetical protein
MIIIIILRGLSPRANYTDRETTACRRSQCQLLWIEGSSSRHAAGRIPYIRNLAVLDRSRYFSFK